MALSKETSTKLKVFKIQAEPLLAKLCDLLPKGYKLTIVARHETIANAQVILTEDPDIKAVAKELLEAKKQ